LSDGGLATGTITQVFGEKALGKSILSLQAAFATADRGNSAVILDTEQSYSNYLLPYWEQRLSDRFGKKIPVLQASLGREPCGQRKKNVARSQLVTSLSSTLKGLGVKYSANQLDAAADALSPELKLDLPDCDGPSVILVQVPEVIDLLGLHGVKGRIAVSEGGRVEMRLEQTPVYHSLLYDAVAKTKAKLLVYDSVSAPLKAYFSGTADLPARSSSLAMMLMHAQRLCIEFDLAVLATSHVSIDPINGWNRHPYGGVILGHEAKFSFELSKVTAKRNEDAVAVNPDEAADASRVVWVQRHPAMADYSKFGYFRMDDAGIH
jgi:RecA/RadA recombinase